MEPEKKPSASASAASPSSSAAAPPPAPVYLELSPDLLPLDDNEMKIIEEDNAFELEAAVKLEDMGDEGVQHAPMPPTLPAGPPPKATAQSAERSDGVAAFKTAFLKLLRAEMGLDEDGSEWPPFPSDTTRPDQWPRFPPTEQQLAVWNAIPPSQRPPLWTIGKLKLRLAWDLHPTHPSIETYLISLRNRILASPAVYCVDPDLGLEQASVALMQAYTEVRRLGKRANVANKAGVALEAAAASSTTTTTSGTPAAGGSSGPGTKAGTTSDVTPVAAAPGIAVQPPPPRRLAPAASGSGGAAANVATIPPTASSSRAVGATQAIPVPSGATAPMAAATRAAASASSQGANPSRANVYARIAELHALAMNISRSGLATANQTSLPAGAARPAAAGGTSGATATPILAGPSETGKKRVREEREDEGDAPPLKAARAANKHDPDAYMRQCSRRYQRRAARRRHRADELKKMPDAQGSDLEAITVMGAVSEDETEDEGAGGPSAAPHKQEFVRWSGMAVRSIVPDWRSKELALVLKRFKNGPDGRSRPVLPPRGTTPVRTPLPSTLRRWQVSAKFAREHPELVWSVQLNKGPFVSGSEQALGAARSIAVAKSATSWGTTLPDDYFDSEPEPRTVVKGENSSGPSS